MLSFSFALFERKETTMMYNHLCLGLITGIQFSERVLEKYYIMTGY